MAKVLINDGTLIDIANAIRAKDGSTAQMYPSEMASKIGAIETAGKMSLIDTENAVYTLPAAVVTTTSAVVVRFTPRYSGQIKINLRFKVAGGVINIKINNENITREEGNVGGSDSAVVDVVAGTVYTITVSNDSGRKSTVESLFINTSVVTDKEAIVIN